MQKTLAEIAAIVKGRLIGDGGAVITGISGIKEAKEGDLTFLANPKYLPLAAATHATAILVGKDVAIEGKAVIQTDNPSIALVTIAGILKDAFSPKIKGVHSRAVIEPGVVLAEGVGVGPNAVIDEGAKIGRHTMISAGVYIGRGTVIGENCLIYPNVTIRENIVIGNNVIIHSGSVVGSDGFGYIQMGEQHMKIPQAGTVVIGDDVELGSCVTVDRARFDKTVIGKGTKVDNHVQIAHNVRIGDNCIMVAYAGIAGSSRIGNRVIMAGQSGIAGHLTVGDDVVIAGRGGVTHDLPTCAKVSGFPAQDHRKALRQDAHVQRLSEYADEIKLLKKKVASLEEAIKTSHD
ncbi:MAG: UDP-3-O-(3-hydroxymyristoyl)glucosamine N-acyltransferase [Candidatus Omnitrophica bacterium]|nr:UDP-3-O-(3-hydroxymyristoyl)glucosamine N-acyltransferase [Candidatus Omnitrophota bacterium]